MNARSFAGTVAIAALLGGAACASPARTTAATSSTVSSAPTTSTTLASTAPTVAVVPTTLAPPSHVGSLVSIPSDGVGPSAQVTVVGVVDPAGGADQFAVPVAGDRYVGVQLRVAFNGAIPLQEDLAGDTSIDDAQGSTYSSTQANLQNCSAFSPGLTLSPGKVVTGCVAFEVSATAKITDITFTPGGQLGNVSAEWDIP